MGDDLYKDLELLAKEMMKITVARNPSYKLPETFLTYVPDK